jgi:hypothetical protein
MVTVPDPGYDGIVVTISGQHEINTDSGCWREAARLRREFRGWVIIWLSPAGEYRAYRRLPGARRDTALSATTPDELAAQITRAEQASRVPARRSGHG